MNILFNELKKDIIEGNYTLAHGSRLPTEWPNENDYFSVFLLKFNSNTKRVKVIDDAYFKDLSSKSSMGYFNNILDSYIDLATKKTTPD